MRLVRIELTDFKRFRSPDSSVPVTFSPRVNVVKGSLNETGKSTLLKGIVAALFYDVKSVKEEVKDCFSWGSDRRCKTSLEFEEKGKAYSLYKDFESRLVSFIGHYTGEKLDTPKTISAKMKELLGTDSDRFFSLTSCIYQDDVKAISSGKKEISESLEEVVTGGKEGTLASQAMKKLGDKISEMRKGLDRLAKTKGSLASLRDQRDEYSRKLTKARDEVSEVEARRIKLMEVNEQLANVRERYEIVKALLDNNGKLKKIEESISRLREKYGDVKQRLDGIGALMTRLKEVNEALSSIEGFEDELYVLEFRRRLNEIHIRRKDIESGLNKLQKEVAEAQERLNKRKPLRFLSLRESLVIAATISIGGVVGTLTGSLYFLSLIILGTAFLAAGMWARSVLASKRTEISEWKGRVQRMTKTLGELGEEQMRILGEAKCRTIDEYDKKEKDFKYLLEEKRSLEAQLKGMLGDNKTVEDLQKQEREIATDLAVEKAGLNDDLRAAALNPEKHIEKRREFQSLDAEKNRLEREKMECEITIKRAGSSIEDQIKLEEQLGRLEEELKQEEKRARVYELAKDFISKARDEALTSITDDLREKIQEYFEIFTDGKYKQVEIAKDSKGDLGFWVYSDEKGGLAKPEELSGGAIDEFYLACRLALVKLIFRDKKPPLILDDPFVNFDSVRLNRTLDFLKTLSSDYQIIIFTLGDSYDKVADNIILLDENAKPPSPNSK